MNMRGNTAISASIIVACIMILFVTYMALHRERKNGIYLTDLRPTPGIQNMPRSPETGREKVNTNTLIYPSPHFIDELGKRAIENLTEALNIIDHEVSIQDRSTVRFDLMKLLCARDLGFLQKIEEVLDPRQCMALIDLMGKAWAEAGNSLDVLIPSIKTLGNENLQTQALSQMAQAYTFSAKFDEARICLNNMTGATARVNVIRNLAANEAINRPAGAVDLAEILTDMREISVAYAAIADSFTKRKDIAGLIRLSQNANADAQPLIWSGVGKIAGASGDGAVFDRYGNLPQEAKNALFIGYMSSATMSQMQELLPKAMTSGQDRVISGAGMIYVMRTTEVDPAAAAKWVLTSPETIRENMLSFLIDKWYEKDKSGAIKWVENLDEGNDKDISLKVASRILGRTDKVGALRLAGMIGNLKTRELTLKYMRD